MLVLVVGPSGAGKDSLLDGARIAFRDDPRIAFARRAITRPNGAGGEDHDAVTDAEFAERDFALSWSAHGLRYGIPTSALAAAPVSVANVSRGVIAAAAERFSVHVIQITAPPAILAARLAARGRETPDDIARRMDRSVRPPGDVPMETVMNDGDLARGIDRFVAVLTRLVERG